MSGFGAMKKDNSELNETLKRIVQANADLPEKDALDGIPETEEQVTMATDNTVEEVTPPKPKAKPAAKPKVLDPMELELMELASKKKTSSIFAGLVGHENSGKSGTAMDAHMYCVQNGAYGPEDQMWVVDFDNGGAACRSAHYGETPNIRVWNPWMMQADNRTAYDYPATHDRIMKICMFALKKAKEQNEEGYEGPKIRNFLVTAVDQFDSVCINNMKIYDMETGAKDAIEASKHIINTKIGWNWNIRSTRFHQLTAICRQLNDQGVNVFWETHLAPEVFADKQTGSWRPKWEKQTDNNLNQILWFSKESMRNDDGKKTGEVRYNVEFYKSKTNPKLQNQSRTVFVTKTGEDPTWYGLPELRDQLL